jgi:hypothetical protein
MQEEKHLQLNAISAYKVAFNLGNFVWHLISAWPAFNRDTGGRCPGFSSYLSILMKLTNNNLDN